MSDFPTELIKTQNRGRYGTHVAASQIAVPSGADHAGGDQAAPPVVPGAGGVANHGQEGLLQGVSDGASGWERGGTQ